MVVKYNYYHFMWQMSGKVCCTRSAKIELRYFFAAVKPELYQKLDSTAFQLIIANLSATTAANCAVNKYQVS